MQPSMRRQTSAAEPSVFPAGTYASYSIRLKSNASALYLQQGATILAAPTLNGKGYDAQEPQNPAYEAFQDLRPQSLAQQP